MARGTVVVALAGGLAGAVLFLLAFRGMPDDSYITLDYAKNLVEHGHWGLTRFRDANTATSPLNIWLLAGGILVTGRPAVAVGIVLVLTMAALAVWAAGLAEELGLRRPVVAGLVVGLIVTSPIFASVVGMESFLVAATLVGVARYAVARRPVAAGVVRASRCSPAPIWRCPRSCCSRSCSWPGAPASPAGCCRPWPSGWRSRSRGTSGPGSCSAASCPTA